jgi:hypothetical protein
MFPIGMFTTEILIGYFKRGEAESVEDQTNGKSLCLHQNVNIARLCRCAPLPNQQFHHALHHKPQNRHNVLRLDSLLPCTTTLWQRPCRFSQALESRNDTCDCTTPSRSLTALMSPQGISELSRGVGAGFLLWMS